MSDTAAARQIRHFLVILLVVWTAAVALSALWNIYLVRTTPSGRRLVLLSPAQMLSEVYAMDRGAASVSGRITSLAPLNPENTPEANC
ncbi:MAG: hypothetical protein IPK16_31740 [Anaerolineales bacterium]|nr:hypothetical protein [Anaerolineales bacterium]